MQSPRLFLTILIVQVLCALFFVVDILLSIFGVPVAPVPWRWHEVMEIGAAAGLIIGVVSGALLLKASLARATKAETAFRAASGAFMDVVDDHFTRWGLTPAERDVALFALKGMSLAEIAELRQTSEGTVKAQTNAIYRKANVTSRTQLLSLFVDELMTEGGIGWKR